MSYGLGLDAGGAYTDAVLMNMSDGRIVGKAKAPTTMDDLSVGIGEAVGGLRAFDGGDVAMVSLSSTLAANSVVEGKGCRVGLVCIGRAFDGSVPVDACAVISGGHDAKGREACALDEEAARNAVASMKGRVDGIAVRAITGSIMETLDALIRPRAGGDPNDPPCTAFSMLGRMEFGSVSEALEHLSDEGGENVRKRAEKAGADDADVKMEVSERRYEIGGGDVLLEIDVHISAIGKPRHLHARP